ncbi:MAG: acetyl-CoA carboxylase biotin carboxyl carrier protein [Steroidobacteraceae bacterium]
MSLTARDVAEITRLLEESNFDELYLELDGLKVTLRRGSAATMHPPIVAPVLSAAAAASTQSAAASAAPTRAAALDPDEVSVSAPLLGTFYRAPKPGAAPFVEIGSHVEADTIIGIIEVMKLMNTVRAGLRGTVTQIFGRDGALVEYGEALLRVKAS